MPTVSAATLFRTTTSEHQRFIAFVDKLRRLGIERDCPIPQIAVAGDQSAGKSSVLELISGIPFPRGTGTVTKCAIRICMRQCDTWSASLFRQPETGDPTEPEQVEDLESLGTRISEHQAVLCPNGTVSSGVIDITLEAPDVPNLTLIDLPGIVHATTTGQSESMVSQVSELVDSYLQQERTLILAVLESHRDVATQDIVTRARNVDPDGLRTIGVLTKPDLVEAGNEAGVMRLLRGDECPLLHGYYVVKGRGPSDQTQPRDEALRADSAFFASGPFADAPSERCGVPALASKLSELLVAHIRKCLPQLADDVRTTLASTKTELGTMGRAPPTTEGERRIAVQEMTLSLCQSVRAYAEEDNGALATQMTGTCMPDLEAAVRASRPDFEGRQDTVTLEFDLRLDDRVVSTCEVEWALHNQDETMGDCRVGATPQCPAFENTPCRVKAADGTWTNKVITRSDAETEKQWATVQIRDAVETDTLTTYKAADVRVTKSNRFLTTVEDRLKRQRGRVMTGFLNWPVFKAYTKEQVEEWQTPLQTATDTLVSQASAALAQFVDAHPEVSRYPEIAPKFKRALAEAHQRVEVRVRDELKELLKKESVPSTENHYLYDTLNKIRGQRLLDDLKSVFEPEGTNTYTDKQVMTQLERAVATCVGNRSNEEQEAQEMVDMLRTYWKVAQKRFVDNVRQTWDTYFVGALLTACEAQLATLLGLSDATLAHLLVESPVLTKRRTELAERVARLSKAQEEYTRWEEAAGEGVESEFEVVGV